MMQKSRQDGCHRMQRVPNHTHYIEHQHQDPNYRQTAHGYHRRDDADRNILYLL